MPTFHSAQDINALVRDFTKWDDTPVSLQHFAQSIVRAYKIAMTPPYGPVVISLDAGLQQEPVNGNGEKLYIPSYVPTSPPQGDTGAVREAAQLLANAEQSGDRGRPRGAHAERHPAAGRSSPRLLQAPVVDQGAPHELPEDASSQPPRRGVIAQADVILGWSSPTSGRR